MLLLTQEPLVQVLEDTSDGQERLGQILRGAAFYLQELKNHRISAEKRPKLVEGIADIASQALDVASKFSSRGVTDETYLEFDKMFVNIRTEARLALFDDDLRPIAQNLRDVESDFCDLSVLAEAEERRTIVQDLEECDNAISEAKNLVPSRSYAETQEQLGKISRKVKSIQSLIETAKISAFRKATAVCVASFGVGLVPSFLTSPEVVSKISPYIVMYLSAIGAVTFHTWVWTKSKTGKTRSRDSDRVIISTFVMMTLMSVLAGQVSGTQAPSPLSSETGGVLIQIALGLLAGIGLILGVVRLIRYASKLQRRTYGLDP